MNSTRGVRITDPAEAPEGTRIETAEGELGTVLGYVRSSIVIGWDGGGTHAAPLSHGGLWTHVSQGSNTPAPHAIKF